MNDFFAGVVVALILILVATAITALAVNASTDSIPKLCDKQGYFQVDQKRYTCKEVK